MKCTNCSADNPEGAKFCKVCGAALSTPMPDQQFFAPTSQVYTGNTASTQQIPFWQGDVFNWVMVALGLCCCFAFPIVAIFCYRMNPVATDSQKRTMTIAAIAVIVIGIILSILGVLFSMFGSLMGNRGY